MTDSEGRPAQKNTQMRSQITNSIQTITKLPLKWFDA
jgi:hypothetical protein